jgi:dienelactone hydrolase
MRTLKVLFVLAALVTLSGQAERWPPELILGEWVRQTQPPWGPNGAEGEFFREQPWVLPTLSFPNLGHAYLFRPPGDGPFRIAVIAHASPENKLRRAQMPQPEYRALSAFLVARGFAVLVPERLGHGATGGPYLEGQGDCESPDYDNSGREIAMQIDLAKEALRSRSFIRKDGVVVIGHSAGGWGALYLAGRKPEGVSTVVVFAPGRGGHADDVPGKVCAHEKLIETAKEFGERARIPVTWLVAENDTYFPPDLSRRLAEAFRAGGGKAAFSVLPASGSEGHWLAESESGVRLAAAELDRALKSQAPATAKRR